MAQVLSNLLNNAAKYTPAGGHIELALGVEGGDAVLRVSDDGIGIDAALLPCVFDLFTQGERTPDRSQGGLGIGLALVRSIVELHGGMVTARNLPTGGAAFEVSLPLDRPVAASPLD